jgi:hypothetical protein
MVAARCCRIYGQIAPMFKSLFGPAFAEKAINASSRFSLELVAGQTTQPRVERLLERYVEVLEGVKVFGADHIPRPPRHLVPTEIPRLVCRLRAGPLGNRPGSRDLSRASKLLNPGRKTRGPLMFNISLCSNFDNHCSAAPY